MFQWRPPEPAPTAQSFIQTIPQAGIDLAVEERLADPRDQACCLSEYAIS